MTGFPDRRGPADLPRVVATDLDGTIVRRDGTVSRRTIDALNDVENAGALVVIVTGRPPRWLLPVARETGRGGLAICANGALVYDLATERVVAERLIEPATAGSVVASVSAARPGAAFAVERATEFLTAPGYLAHWPEDGSTTSSDLPGLTTEPVAKLLVRDPGAGPDDLATAVLELVGDRVEITHSSDHGLIEISAAGVTKATTLERLCAEQGVPAGDVLAFGDMPNDLAMLTWAGRGVAVANAHPAVLSAIDEHTDHVDDDGVARYLERLLAGDPAGV